VTRWELGDTLASVRERPEREKHRTEVTEATEEELVRGFELTNALFRRPHSIFLAKQGQPRESARGNGVCLLLYQETNSLSMGLITPTNTKLVEVV
jgi:hypothetical protein